MKGMVELFLAMLAALQSPVALIEPARATPAQAPNKAETQPRSILVMLKPAPVRYGGSDNYASSYGSALSKASRDRIGRRLASAHHAQYVGFWELPEIGLDCLILEFPAGSNTNPVIAAIQRDKAVEWAEPMEEYNTLEAVKYNDPLYPASPATRLWYLDQLHSMATGKGVSVAVVDSAIDGSHPDLHGQMRLTRDFVEDHPSRAEPHGTAVAGIIAARANNGIGIVGIAPDARLLGLRACWQTSGQSICNSLSLAKAMHFAIANNVDVLNMSLTGPRSELLSRLLDRAKLKGIVVIASVDPKAAEGGFPASKAGVIAVTSGMPDKLSGSVFRAPGAGVPTTKSGGGWHLVNGSSFSAAHVSGLFALMIERRGHTRNQLVLVRAAKGGAIDAVESVRQATAR